MKYLFVLCCVLTVVVSHPAEDKYPDKFDNINVQEILDNERLLKAYVDCVMERGKCTPEGKELKEHMRDAIENECKKCTEAQEKGATTVIDFLIKNKIEIWREIADKFDPERKYRKKYEERARANGIIIPE